MKLQKHAAGIRTAALLGLAGVALVQAALLYPLNDGILFDPEGPGAQGWGQPRGLELATAEGMLSLTIRQPDSSIQRSGLALDPGMFEWLHVRYRASGFAAEETRGELFYANAAHAFADQQYVRLPALVCDGQWQDLWVNLPRSLRGQAEDWWQNGPVTALRLDLVNEAPGSIDIALIRLTARRDEVLVPAGGRCLRRWTEPHALVFEERDGLLALDIRERDCRLHSLDVPLDPAAARYLAIRYRAWDFQDEKTGGQIFYANSRHPIEAPYQWPLPTLLTDGRWHDLVIDAAQAMGRGYQDWACGGPVTALRLDLVDQAPGKVEIAVVLTTPRLHVTSLDEVLLPAGRCHLLPATAFACGSVTGGPRACSLDLPNGPHSLWLRLLDLPAAYDVLPRLEIEGAERGPVASGASGTFLWVRLGRTLGGRLRLALPDDAGFLLDAVLVSEGDEPPQDRPVTALQPVTSTIRPLGPKPRTMVGPYWAGEMISCPEAGEKDPQLSAVRTLFRRTIEVPADVTSAWLQISVDDFFRLYLDGTPVGENLRADSWMTPTLWDLSQRVRPGQRHCLAVEAFNVGGPGGVFLDLVLNRADHSVVRIASDSTWRCRGKAPEGWAAMDYDDSDWLTPVSQPGPPNAPWVVAIPYVNKAWEPPTRLLELTGQEVVTAGEVQQIACRLQSEQPLAAGEVLVATLIRVDTGKTLMRKEFQLSDEQVKPAPDGSVHLGGLQVPISRWCPPLAIELTVALPGRRLEEGRSLRFAVRNARPREVLTSEVRVADGLPRLWVNGQPFVALVGNGEGRDREGTAAAYKAAGFNVSAVWVDGMGRPQWWTGPSQFEFAPVDELLTAVLDHDPETLLLPIVWAAPPPWWAERNPAEIARFSDGTSWPYYRSTPSFNSPRWREDATQAVDAFVRHLEQGPYAGRVLGYWVIGGVSAEWQGWGCHNSAANEHLMDYSEPEQTAFRTALRSRYPDRPELHDAAIPDLPARLGRELGVFRDPARSLLSIAYTRMVSESVAAMMLACVGAAKNACDRQKIVGTYYGYSLEYANMDWALQMSGHNAVRRALDSPDLDFLSAPHSYAVRRLGEDMGWMWAASSIQRAGKLFWPDDDSRTHLSGPCDYNPTVNPAQTREALRRNWGKQLCHLNPVGFLQIASGRELDSPAIARDARITRRAAEFALRQGMQRRAEIAAVIDEESIPYLAHDSARLASDQIEPVLAWNGDQWFTNRRVNNLAAELLGYQRSRLARIGAPVDTLLLSDLATGPLHYKLYIMLSCCRYDDAILAAVQRQIHERGATVLWCYAPGFIRGDTAAVGHMQELTGLGLRRVMPISTPVINLTDLRSPLTGAGLLSLSFGAPYGLDPLFAVDDPAAEVLGVYRDSGLPALAAKQVGRSRSLFCGSHILPPDLLRNLARAAGVHLYTDSGDVLEANDHFAMLHTSSAGQKTLRLPRRSDVVEVYSAQVLFRGVDSFSLVEAAQTTRLFYLGAADEFLQAMDYPGL
jgi:hypothetical protein